MKGVANPGLRDQIVGLYRDGLRNTDIAIRLGITKSVVSGHLRRSGVYSPLAASAISRPAVIDAAVMRALRSRGEAIAQLYSLTRAKECASRNQHRYKIRVRAGVGPEALLSHVCSIIGANPAEIRGKRSLRHIALQRHEVMWILREIYGWAYPQIGRVCGGRDHSSVIYGVSKWQSYLDALGNQENG